MTAEQKQLWDELGFDKTPEASGDQTPEQAANLKVHSFRHTCQLEGVAVPTEDEVRAHASWG